MLAIQMNRLNAIFVSLISYFIDLRMHVKLANCISRFSGHLCSCTGISHKKEIIFVANKMK